MARALLAQLVWAHSPADVGIAVICKHPAEDWDWLKWLPHNLSRFVGDGPLGIRLIADSIGRGAALLRAEADFGSISHRQPDRRLVTVIDLLDPPAARPGDISALRTAAESHGAVLLHLVNEEQAEPELADIRVTAGRDGAGSIEWASTGVAATHCSLDQLDIAEMTVLARSFAPLRPADDASHPVATQSAMDSVRFSDVGTLDPAVTWRRRSDTDLLRVPIGVGTDGSLVAVDLKESAAGGMGPHGLVVGATGSGKSELLRTLVTTLAISHPPESLALLLADFKGGATFSGLATLPHIAGMVTNLEADLGLVDRFRHALSGELQRRQEILAAAGKVSSLDAYQSLRSDRPDLPPLPRLLVIVDEFSELLSAKPDLAELFVAIGRVGRSIGIHLLLATQRLDTGRIRGLESHLSYRICLRTFSEAESREAIGSPAAYRLPAEPGWAYLLADNAEPVRFRAATVSRPYRPTRQARTSAPPRILPLTVENRLTERMVDLQSRPTYDAGAGSNGRGALWRHRQSSVLDIAVERLTAGARRHPRGQPVRPVWLAPLPERLELGRLLDMRSGVFPTRPAGLIDPQKRRPVSSSAEPRARELVARLGLVDIPEKQRQETLRWDFDEGNGNLLIVGTGRSGKSTAVCTLLTALAADHPPGEIEMLCVDFGGESLLAYRDLPHVAAVATRSDPELTRLVFSRVQRMLTDRELLFRRNQFDSAAAVRQARSAGTLDQSVPGAVVLIIDGWAGLREVDPSVESALEDVLSRGPGLGVHTVLTISATGQLRTRLAAGFSGRIELRLADAFESTIDRQLAKALSADRPGRAVVAGGHFAQLAQPLSTAGGSQGQLVEQIQRHWPGPGVPKVKTLPEVVQLAEIQQLVAPVDAGHRVGTAGGVVAPVRGVDGRRADEVGRIVRADSGAAGPGRPGQPPLLLGVSEHDMAPVQHSLTGANPHLLIYGDTGSGKTALLRSIVQQLLSGESSRPSHAGGPTQDAAAWTTPEVLAVDYRRGPPSAAGKYQRFTRAAEVSAVCAALAGVLTARLAEAVGSVPS
ncbi:MAG: type VII secretion protein EccCa, partial [Nakamurella sp.]